MEPRPPPTSNPAPVANRDSDFFRWFESGRRVATNHLTYVIAFGTFAFVGLKVLAVASFNTNVALAVLAAADPARVLLGLFVSLVSAIATAVLLFSLVGLGLAVKARRGQFVAMFAVIVSLLFALLTARLAALGYVGVLASVITLAIWLGSRSDLKAEERGNLSSARDRLPDSMYDENAQQHRDTRASLYVSSVVAILLAVVVTAVETRPWVPSERIETASGNLVGYVINDDGRWTTVLTGPDVTLLILRSDSIVNRTLCEGRSREIWTKTLVEVLSGSNLNQCPSP